MFCWQISLELVGSFSLSRDVLLFEPSFSNITVGKR